MVSVSLGADTAGEILARAAAGDEAAFTRIVATHHQDMRRVAFVVCGDPDLAEDACQQAWQIAWRKLGRVREADKLRSWLVAVAANEARKIGSRERRGRLLEASVRPIRAGDRAPDDSLEIYDLERALRRLKPDDRVLLALRYRAGLDSNEIAGIRGGSASGIRARIGRLLDRLRKELEDG